MIERGRILGNIERSMNNKKPMAEAETTSLLNEIRELSKKTHAEIP